MLENEPSIIRLEKISSRVKGSNHPIIHERLSNLHKIDYEVYGHQSCNFGPNRLIFTILLTLHDSNLEYVVQSIESIQQQTYPNTELRDCCRFS